MSLYSYIRLQKYSNISRTLSSQLLSRSRFCFSLSPCVKKVVQQVLSTSLLFSLSALAKGFIAYYPGMRPCFDLNFPVLCCLVVWPSSMAPLTGLLENRTPFILVLVPRERRKLCRFPQTLVPWVGLPDFVVLVVMKSYS